MSECACLQILSSRWFSNAAAIREGGCSSACLGRDSAPVDDPALNCDPGAMMRFRVPCADGTSERDVIFMVFVVRGGAPASETQPVARARPALAESSDGSLTPHEKRLLK